MQTLCSGSTVIAAEGDNDGMPGTASQGKLGTLPLVSILEAAVGDNDGTPGTASPGEWR
jgi:hypothetical protein